MSQPKNMKEIMDTAQEIKRRNEWVFEELEKY